MLGGVNDGLVLLILVFYSCCCLVSFCLVLEVVRWMCAVSARFEGAVFVLGKKLSGVMIGMLFLL